MTAHIKQHNGTPTLFLDGEPTFAGYLWTHPPYTESYPAAPCASEFAKAGVHLYALDVGTQGASPEWCGPRPGNSDHFDFSTLEANLCYTYRFTQVFPPWKSRPCD